MKKFISILLSLLLILSIFSACSEQEPKQLRIVSVQDSACIALADMIEKNANSQNEYNYISTVTNLPSMANKLLTDGDCDIAFVPADMASVMYKKTKGAVTVLAAISNLDYQIVSTGELNSIADLKGTEINLLDRDRLDENLLEYTLEANSVSADEYKITYKAPGVKQLAKEIKAGRVGTALLNAIGAAELLTLEPGLKTLSLNDEWNKISNVPAIGYCAVVSNEFLAENEEAVETFIKNLESSLKAAGNKIQTLKLAKELGLLTNENYGEFIYNNANFNFLKGEQMKTALKNYYAVLKTKKAALIGTNLPDDIFYYIPEKDEE